MGMPVGGGGFDVSFDLSCFLRHFDKQSLSAKIPHWVKQQQPHKCMYKHDVKFSRIYKGEKPPLPPPSRKDLIFTSSY
jgi:hypothetical protein